MTRVHSGGSFVRLENRAAPMRRSSATLTSQGEETGETTGAPENGRGRDYSSAGQMCGRVRIRR